MEIITGVERRRRWRDEDKLRIVAEAEAPGAIFAEVARRHEVSRGQLWSWRRLVRAGELRPAPMPAVFLPVRMAPESVQATGPVRADAVPCDPPGGVARDRHPEGRTATPGRIEVRLPGGARVVIEGAVEPALVVAALTALR